MVNGKPQIYFDALGLLKFIFIICLNITFSLDESPIKLKPKRNSRAINTTRPPEQPKPKPINQKTLSQNGPNKQTKKTNKVTFNDDSSKAGVFMTMDEISELVKAVKENTKAHDNTVTENRGNFSLVLSDQRLYVLYRTATSSATRTTTNE
jgi:hypothetical protein